MITDPILKSKVNSYNEEFGLYYSYDRLAMSRKMREQDQGLSAYLLFINEREQAYYSGYESDSGQVEGFSTIVLGYFKGFPENLHESIFDEISSQIESGYSAKIDAAKMRLNQLMIGESQGDRSRTEELIKSNITYITTKELARLFQQLREIRQRRLLEEAKKEIPTSYEQIVKWGKNNKIIAGVLIVSAAIILISQVYDAIKNIRCGIFNVKCELESKKESEIGK
jgi:hypothetical protein